MHWEDHPQQDFMGILEQKRTVNVKDIKGVYGSRPSGASLNLEPKKALYMTLWYLGTPISHREISELFGVSEGVIFDCMPKK
ncbi:uncharacterized protein LOC122260145 [Penaeus japonicus]|uniref:uncharacterized protein LOC122260145 n=1 Tax=Penaeus japonicus TaxID=27405 RepID=UPI001C717197|nr:uncharacterized protein LOC122260145 [Penaeus japonicus]